MSQTLLKWLLRAFSRSVNKVVRKNGEAKTVHIVVEGSQRHPDIDTSSDKHLSGRIERKPELKNKFIKLID